MGILGRWIIAAALAAAPMVAPAATADGSQVAVVVSFSPQFEARLRSDYGVEEGEVLRTVITQALGSRLGATTDPLRRVSVEVVLESAKPTHPTPRQLAREPGLDFLRSLSPGGAELSATLRGADGRSLGQVSYSYFAPTLQLASRAGEAWADARLSIEGFAAAGAAKLRAHA